MQSIFHSSGILLRSAFPKPYQYKNWEAMIQIMRFPFCYTVLLNRPRGAVFAVQSTVMYSEAHRMSAFMASSAAASSRARRASSSRRWVRMLSRLEPVWS